MLMLLYAIDYDIFKPDVVGIFKPDVVCKAEVPLFLAFFVLVSGEVSSTAVLISGATSSPIGDGGTGGGAGFTSGTFGDDKHIFISQTFPLKC